MRWCRWLMVVLLSAISVSLLNAGPIRMGGDPWRDVQQTIQARKLLADDPDLAAWNIGVTIRDRVATLWGPVPSAEVSFRAELFLRSIIELADVHNELVVSDNVEPMRAPWKINAAPLFPPHVAPPPTFAPSGNSPNPDMLDPLRPHFFERVPAAE